MADSTPPDVTALAGPKQELRRRMRELRRSVDDREGRSERIWAVVTTSTGVATARRVLAFRSLAGEPDAGALETWCAARGVDVAVPEDDVDPQWPDVVIVPGLAFTPEGQRLGQGGGWYDRFLVGIRDDCEKVGVCFREQIVDELPIAPHDVAVDQVVTDAGLVVRA
jgi:5-formyltetrahydrofolate cyclo-ligase